MASKQVQLEDLCREANQLLELYFGPAVQCLNIWATFRKFEDIPWEIKVLVPSGELHEFAGSDAENAVRNLERFGLEVIRRGLLHQPTDVQSA